MDGMNISEILNILLGGGLVTAIVAIGTLRSTIRKAKAESMKAEADAETVRMDNAEHATRILVENIVKPLKEELNETRKYLEASKREMARLRKAIDTANSCKHHDDCPVLVGLRDKPKGERAHGGSHSAGARGQPADGSAGGVDRSGADGGSPSGDTAGGTEHATAGR